MIAAPASFSALAKSPPATLLAASASNCCGVLPLTWAPMAAVATRKALCQANGVARHVLARERLGLGRAGCAREQDHEERTSERRA